MDALERRRLKKTGIVLATGGLTSALVVGLFLQMLGAVTATYREWGLAVGLTVVVQTLLWVIPHFGWDERLTWDPDYLFLPMLSIAILFSVYSFYLSEARVVMLMVWFVALLFTAGRAGLFQVLVLNTLMMAGYLGAVGARAARGAPVSLPFEATVCVSFLLTGVYAGIMFERLRRDRREMQELRRKLAALALTDPLTGLPNRRQFEESLRGELARTRRYGGTCCLAMIDVDHFKNYNDVLGHPAGDEVLRELGQLMRRHLRTGDVGARYGGEEFAVIMVNTAQAEAVQVIERLRTTIEAYSFKNREVQPGGRLTISAGIAECATHGADDASLVRRADEALYRAKADGRNRICVAA